MSFNAIISEKGWSLKDEFIEDSMKRSKRPTAEAVIENALNQDLKEICKPSTGENAVPSGTTEISGPLVLQIQKIKNVLAPAKYEESGSKSGKFLPKIFFTDGTRSLSGIAFKPIPNIKENTPPGTKIRLVGKVPVVQGFLLLDKSNTEVLGGKVEKMIESWNLKKSMASFERTQKKEGDCPPPFVPFNLRRNSQSKPVPSFDNFRSFEAKSAPKAVKDDRAFHQQRKATIEAVCGETKTYQREKTLTDEQLAELMQMGFSLEDSVAAGKQSQGNFFGAINILTNSK